LSQFNYFGPRNFSVLLPTTLKRYCIQIFRGPLFSRTCQTREIREIKGTPKNGFYSIIYCDIRGDYRERVRYGNRGQITVHNISYIYLLRDRASFPWILFLHGL